MIVAPLEPQGSTCDDLTQTLYEVVEWVDVVDYQPDCKKELKELQHTTYDQIPIAFMGFDVVHEAITCAWRDQPLLGRSDIVGCFASTRSGPLVQQRPCGNRNDNQSAGEVDTDLDGFSFKLCPCQLTNLEQASEQVQWNASQPHTPSVKKLLIASFADSSFWILVLER